VINKINTNVSCWGVSLAFQGNQITDGVSQGLTRDFARIAYNDIPALQHTEITGRTGQVQVNDDGIKTMTTDGTKTIYSWDNNKGEIAQKTETVKRYSDVLENPLHRLSG
jgi:hypothetical protein